MDEQVLVLWRRDGEFVCHTDNSTVTGNMVPDIAVNKPNNKMLHLLRYLGRASLAEHTHTHTPFDPQPGPTP
jgi:hypothetical protein